MTDTSTKSPLIPSLAGEAQQLPTDSISTNSPAITTAPPITPPQYSTPAVASINATAVLQQPVATEQATPQPTPASIPPDTPISTSSVTPVVATQQSVPPTSSLATNPLIRQNQIPLKVATPVTPTLEATESVQTETSSSVSSNENQPPQAGVQVLQNPTIATENIPPELPPMSLAKGGSPTLSTAPLETLAPPLPTPTPTQAPTSTLSSSASLGELEPIITRSTEPIPFQQNRYKGPKPCVLLILDGWGIGPNNAGNAIARAHTPNLSKYWMSYPHTQLEASGTAVGLPQGEDGNTETGHLNIGAGHIVYQDLPRINMSIADGGFFHNSAFLKAINHAKSNDSTLHLMGLIGAGGVHSNIEHLFALLNLCAQQQLTKVLIHGFTDGRDSPPTSGINYVQEIMNLCEKLGVGELASLMGRYFAMDRDRRWERIEKAYNALTIGEGNSCIINPIDALKQQYDQGVTDEFIEPITICNRDGSHRVISDNDAVIFFNYRIDRPRELTRAFVLPNFENGMASVAFDPYAEKYEKTNIQRNSVIATFQRRKVVSNLCFVTMTMYEDNMPVEVAFPPQHIKEPLGKVFADNGLRQLRTTETEKERFVTYYMNGQVETLYPGEERVILPSKGVKSYDEAPEMSAREIATELVKYLETNLYDVVIANICNGDMVGHTGNIEAAVKACSIVDEVVGKIVEKVLLLNGMVFITADHGNVEEMINNSTGEVDTEHSIYPVPFYIIGKQFAGKSTMLPTGILADVAPTILHCMGLAKPAAMTGRALI